MNRELKRDVTGIPILPRETTGYKVKGVPCTYQAARRVLSELCVIEPKLTPILARDARVLNQMHLYALLRAHLYMRARNEYIDFSNKWAISNLPRADRRKWQRLGMPVAR